MEELRRRCAEERARQTQRALDYPVVAQRLRSHAASRGFAAACDDPPITVLASQLEWVLPSPEVLAALALLVADPTPRTHWTPQEWSAHASAPGIVRRWLGGLS